MENIIFHDLDGNIIDDFNFVNKMANKILKECGSSYDFSIVRKYGLRKMMMFSDVPHLMPLILIKLKKELQKADIDAVRGIRESLGMLKEAGYQQVILSNNSPEFSKRILERNDLSEYFSEIYNVGFLSKGLSMKRLCRHYGINPEDTAYVTDECRDIRAIKRRSPKTRIVAVTWGFNSEERLRNTGPDYIARTPKEMSDFFISGKIFGSALSSYRNK